MVAQPQEKKLFDFSKMNKLKKTGGDL